MTQDQAQRKHSSNDIEQQALQLMAFEPISFFLHDYFLLLVVHLFYLSSRLHSQLSFFLMVLSEVDQPLRVRDLKLVKLFFLLMQADGQGMKLSLIESAFFLKPCEEQSLLLNKLTIDTFEKGYPLLQLLAVFQQLLVQLLPFLKTTVLPSHLLHLLAYLFVPLFTQQSILVCLLLLELVFQIVSLNGKVVYFSLNVGFLNSMSASYLFLLLLLQLMNSFLEIGESFSQIFKMAAKYLFVFAL